MREVAEIHRTGRHAARRQCVAGGVCAAARLSARLGAGRPGAGIGGLGAGLVRGERPAVVLCAAGGELRNRAATPFTLTECRSPASGCRARCEQAEAHSVILVAVGAGPEAEEEARRRWEDEKPDEYFFLEMFGFRGRRASDHSDRSASLRLGGTARHGGAAALQSRISGVGRCGAAAAARTDEADAKRAFPFPRGSVRLRHVAPQENAAGGLRIDASYRAAARLTESGSLRELLLWSVPVPARAVPAGSAVDAANSSRFASRCSIRTPQYSVNRKALKRWAEERLSMHTEPGRLARRAVPLRWDHLHQHGPAADVSLQREAGSAR